MDTQTRLMMVKMMAGMAIAQTATTLPHGLSYPVTVHLGVPHGKACAYFTAGYLAEAPADIRDYLLTTAGFTSIEIEGGHFMVCDTCDREIKPEESCYYIAVLNRVFCKDCFENWHNKATYYPEDARFERMHHKHTITLLRNAGVDVEEQEKKEQEN